MKNNKLIIAGQSHKQDRWTVRILFMELLMSL